MSVPVPPPHPDPPGRSPVRDWVRRHPWWFTTLFVAATFLAASVLPVWTRWDFEPKGFFARSATFWEAASALWAEARQPDGTRLVSQPYLWGPNAVKLVGVLAVSTYVGRRLAGFRPPDQAADYDDAPPPPPTGP